MNQIQVLPSEVVDQISAGEVIERPAQLVKELVENALDAGSTQIEIEYADGGRTLQVSDNGRGIAAEDLKLAVMRFATSKIKTADDLWSLSSFGFRGEALASAAAVSKLEIKSRPESAKNGHRLLVDFGRIQDVEPSAANKGTVVRTEGLFENTPVRLKFLKSESSEASAIRTMVKALALANENTKFTLKSVSAVKNRIELMLRPASFVERSREILELPKMFLAEGKADVGSVEIAFAGPDKVHGTSRNIWLFVQGRYVQDRGIQAAVMEAYRSLLMHGEFPICVVRLNLENETVDVNVHPSKAQVKFRKPSDIFSLVHSTLRSALERAPWLETAEAKTKTTGGQSSGWRVPSVDAVYRGERFVPESLVPLRVQEPELRFQPELGLPMEQSGLNSVSSQTRWSDFQLIGQFHATYLVAQHRERLILVDQHAAHERVVFERLIRAFKDGDISESQPMLIPLILNLSLEACEALLTQAEQLRRFGIDLDQSGPQSVAVRSLPTWIKESAAVRALTEFAENLHIQGGSFALERAFSELAASLACHSVVRAGEALNLEQMQALLAQMDEFPLSSFCPHGRPVSIEWGLPELERRFGRIV